MRVPPYDNDAEEALLGAMLLSRDAATVATEILTASDMYAPKHAAVFDAISRLMNSGEIIDPVTVADALSSQGMLDEIGGAVALLTWQSNTPATTNAGRYADIILRKSLLRSLIAAGAEIAELGYEGGENTAEIIDRAESLVFKVAEQRRVEIDFDMYQSLRELVERINEVQRNGVPKGEPSGLQDLDNITGGLQDGSLIVLGARPAIGKSSLALTIAHHVSVVSRKPTLFFSLEMGRDELLQRLVSMDGRINSSKMRMGGMSVDDFDRMNESVARIKDAPLFIDDNAAITVAEIRSKARRLHQKMGGLGLIVVDYIQLMGGGSAENRQLQVSEISRGLKLLAREMECPVLALSQLNRGLEQRSDKRPMLSDLRESGCVPGRTEIIRADNNQTITVAELVKQGDCNIPVWSMDSSGRIVPNTLYRAFPTGPKMLYEVTTAQGKIVEISGNHKMWTPVGWKALGDLQIGDSIAAAHRIPTPLHPLEDPDWSDDKVGLVAHMLGDGCTLPKQPCHYTSSNQDCLEYVEKCAANLGFVVRRDTNSQKEDSGWSNVYMKSPYTPGRYSHSVARKLFEPLGMWGKRSHEKRIPREIFSLGDRQVAHFIRNLWATDGTIGVSGGKTVRGNIAYSTTSRGLAEDISTLLLRFGISAPIRTVPQHGGKHRDGYMVTVDAAPQQRVYIDKIGAFASQQSKLNEMGQFLTTIGPAHTVRLTVAGEKVGESSVDRGVDLRWDHIKSIEPLEIEELYDVTVDNVHSFVTKDIILKNSIEQDSDVVIFIYRDEVYYPESVDKGTAEILVAKHRAGPTGVVRLAYLSHYTRFADMARS